MSGNLVSRVQVPASADILGIVLAAGAQPDDARFGDGVLTVRGVTQEALDAAAAPADPLYAVRIGIKHAAHAEFRQRVAAGLPFRGKVADMDEEQSIPRINGAVTAAMVAQLLGQTFELPWRMADNTYVVLDGTDMTRLGQLVMAYFSGLNAHYWSLADAAATAADEAALAEIDVTADWPEPPTEP